MQPVTHGAPVVRPIVQSHDAPRLEMGQAADTPRILIPPGKITGRTKSANTAPIAGLLQQSPNALANLRAGDLPGNVCAHGACSPQQARIFETFRGAEAPTWDMMPRVFSGQLYLRGLGSNPNHPHFAGFLIDALHDGYTFDGTMTFGGGTENPYRDLDVPAARKRWQGPTPDFLETFDTHAFIDLSRGGSTPIRYWVRQDAESGTLLVVQQVGGGLGLAELSPHQ